MRASTAGRQLLSLFLSLLLLPALGGCASLAVGGAVGFDAGTLGVSGIETGMGGQIEAIAYRWEGSGFGLGPSLQLAGYSSAGDADPIWFTTVELRYRSRSAAVSRPFLELGTGAGLAWSPTPNRLAVPLQVEMGLERVLGPLTGRIGVRERFIGMIGSGSPPVDAFNSVQLVIGLSAGGIPSRP